MAAQMSLQPQSRSHLFRSHSSYSNDIYSMSPPSKRRGDRSLSPSKRRDDRLRSRHYPVQPDRNAPSDNKDRNAPSGDRGHIDPARPQARAMSPYPLYPAHPVPQQLGPPPARSHEVSISNLIEAPTLSTMPMRPARDPRNISPNPADVRQHESAPNRLPGVEQVGIPSLYETRWKEFGYVTENFVEYLQHMVHLLICLVV